MLKQTILDIYHLFAKLRTGFVYVTPKGTHWYIVVAKDTVCVYWRPEHTGPCYRIPKVRWYDFVKDSGVRFAGVQAP